MLLRPIRLLQRLLAITTLTVSLPVLAIVADVAPGSSFVALEPSREHAMTTQQIINNLLRGHYESQRLDNALSSRILDILLKDIDSTRSYLLASDVAEFDQYRHNLDEALNRGDMRPAFFMFNRFQQRVSERLSFLLTEIDSKAADYRYDVDERLDLDREKAPWAKTTAELDDLWRKRLKNSLLNLRSAGKDDKASLELLRKRYQNQLNRVHQSKPEDAYQTFMNAVTRAFDPHTQYFSPRNTENFNINMSLSLQGIGAVLQTEEEHTKVVRLVPGGPAAKAGNLQPADKIIGVGQEGADIVDVIGWRLDEVVELIRGPKGSTVRLEILPASSSGGEPRTIAIVREEVKLEEQSAQKDILEIKDGEQTRRIGVIDIPTFYIDFQGRMENKPDYTSTTRDVARLIKELKAEGIDGLIIDLRNNGGGSLEEAISLTGLFIPTGPVVQVRSMQNRVEVLADQDPSVLYDGPLTVMVNRLSASASEIFAGAIQDYGRGLVVGGQTFGKGTVQSLRPLRSGQLKITQAKFYRISGDSTQNQGVIPDILYPSLFDTSKIGESALEDALPWDAIRPADYRTQPQVGKTVPMLRQLHQKRVEQNADFHFMREQKNLIAELRAQTQVSLHAEIREKERKANDDKRLKLENERRKAKGLPALSSVEELDAEPVEAIEGESAPDAAEKPAEEEDALLTETAHILLDYLKLQPPAAMTAQRSAE